MSDAIHIDLTGKNSTERIKEITDKLETGLKNLFNSDQYRNYLNTMAKFHNYSFNNTLLIAIQKPDAKLLPQYDKVVCVSPQESREAYLIRDRHLVDNSAFCISYCTRRTGGTAYTIRYAEKQRIPVYNTTDFDVSLV